MDMRYNGSRELEYAILCGGVSEVIIILGNLIDKLQKTISIDVKSDMSKEYAILCCDTSDAIDTLENSTESLQCALNMVEEIRMNDECYNDEQENKQNIFIVTKHSENRLDMKKLNL